MSTSPRFAKVLPIAAFHHPLDYIIPEGLSVTVGSIVEVPLGRRTVKGAVMELAENSNLPEAKLKSILQIFAYPPLSKNLLAFIVKAANYNLGASGNFLKMTLSVDAAFEKLKPLPANEDIYAPDFPELSAEQKEAADKLRSKISNGFSVTLLDGVTGSGKTEVYLSAAAKVIESGMQAIIMVPEISLTVQLLEKFRKRFGFTPTEWHSGLTPARRRDNWRRIINGDARIIVGARSALFLPYKAPGLLVVDEEHDHSYKQDEGGIYHARDMSVLRALEEKIPVLLISATPSIETYTNCKNGRYERIILQNRFREYQMPKVELVDLRSDKLKYGEWISSKLKQRIAATMQTGQQVLLYLNRRGFAPLTLCRKCGHRHNCPDCAAWLVYHRTKNKLECHYCGYSCAMPTSCSACGDTENIVMCGPGAERLEDEVRQSFPNARLLTVTSDTVGTHKKITEMINKVTSGEVDIIIGTQMLAKGHHFPALNMVAIIDADSGLGGTDLRAAERTYQMLHQVAGRAGREHENSKVIIQTYMPEHPVLQALAKWDRDGFLEAESTSRMQAGMPPYSRLIAILITGLSEEKVRRAATELSIKAPFIDGVTVLGPVPAPLSQLKKRHRYRFLIKADRRINYGKLITEWLGAVKLSSTIDIKVDVDPYSFL